MHNVKKNPLNSIFYFKSRQLYAHTILYLNNLRLNPFYKRIALDKNWNMNLLPPFFCELEDSGTKCTTSKVHRENENENENEMMARYENINIPLFWGRGEGGGEGGRS